MTNTEANDAAVVLCTCANEQQAAALAHALVDEHLAACVNVLPAVQSIYRWQGAIEAAQEHLLLVKTTRERFTALKDRITQLHAYDTPEIIALPIVDGSEKYLAWLRGQL